MNIKSYAINIQKKTVFLILFTVTSTDSLIIDRMSWDILLRWNYFFDIHTMRNAEFLRVYKALNQSRYNFGWMQRFDFFFRWPRAADFFLIIINGTWNHIHNLVFSAQDFLGPRNFSSLYCFCTFFLMWIYWCLGTLPNSEVIIPSDSLKLKFKSSLFLPPAKNAHIPL